MTEEVWYHLHSPPAVKKQWEEVYNEMIVHTRGAPPGKLLLKQRPNEPKDLFDYRMSIYEPITTDPINRGIDSLYRTIWQSNYVISYSSNLTDYLSVKKFQPSGSSDTGEGMGFKELMFKYIMRVMIDDPNGALVWMPVNPDGGKPSDTRENVTIDVRPEIVGSYQIMHSSADTFCWQAKGSWEMDVKSGKKNLPYFYVLTPEQITIIIPTREATSNDNSNRVIDGFYYEEVFYYNPVSTDGKKSMLPRLIFGGNSVVNEYSDWYYKSFFNGYVAWANEAIRAFSDNQAVRVTSNFPVKEIKGQECRTCKGAGEIKKDGEKTACNTCGGHGVVMGTSPYDVYITEPPDGTELPEWTKKPAVQWHSPHVDILKESSLTWEMLLKKAERAININYIVDAAQSGVSKEMDREQLYTMLFKISNNFFDNIIAKSLEIIENYRVVIARNRQPSTVTAPNSFDIKTQKELMDEIGQLTTNSAPAPFVANVAGQLAHKTFNGDEVTIRIIELQSEYDPFFGAKTTDLLAMQSAGQLNTNDIPRHNYAYQILREIADENTGFLEMSKQSIFEKADAKLEEMIPPPAQVPNTNFTNELLAAANAE